MNPFRRWIEGVWYGPAPPPRWLRPLSRVYGALARRRRQRLSRAAAAVKLAAPVIVVGNVAAGGTGKTPFVIWLVEQLRAQGRRPGVVSRGYGRRTLDARMVTAGSKPDEVGDEPLMILWRTGEPVAVAANRLDAARLLLETGDVDVIVADDGLQHYRLPRALEVAVVDAKRGCGNGWLLPAGPLREPEAKLAEADLVVANGGSWRGPARRLIEMKLTGTEAVNLKSGERLALTEFGDHCVHAVAGIGHPERFFASLRELGLELLPHPFPDHHRFVPADLAFGDQAPVLMTEKDAVKCKDFADEDWWYVPVAAEIPAPQAAVVQELLKSVTAA